MAYNGPRLEHGTDAIVGQERMANAMSQTFASIEASDLEAGMVVRILGQDWTIDQIMSVQDPERKPYGVMCYIKRPRTTSGVEVCDANVVVPLGLCLQVYKN